MGRRKLIVAWAVLATSLVTATFAAPKVQTQLRQPLQLSSVPLTDFGQARLRAAGVAAPTRRAGRAMLPAVDNSTLPWFPAIGDQGTLNSGPAFAATYYLMTYETAKARGWDFRVDSSLANVFSPKFTYALTNGGVDAGCAIQNVHRVMVTNGAPKLPTWPYGSDSTVPRNYREWPTTAPVWAEAIGYRMDSFGALDNSSPAAATAAIKQWLLNGDLVNVSTDFGAWSYLTVQDDPATAAIDAATGQQAVVAALGNTGPHGVTIVGYDDSVWVDINGNGLVDAGEKGAFKIANSFGRFWGNSGFVWVCYDALYPQSQVAGVAANPTREGVFTSPGYWCVAKTSISDPNNTLSTPGAPNVYTPKLLGSLTVNCANRDQLGLTLGIGAVGDLVPTTTFSPFAPQLQGGAYAFDGGSLPIDGTFVLDFTDLVPVTSVVVPPLPGPGPNPNPNPTPVSTVNRFFSLTADSTAGNATLLRDFRLIDVAHGNAQKLSTMVPQTADAASVTAWIDYSSNQLTFDVQPVDTVAGRTIPTLSVAVRDRAGKLLTAFTGNVTLALGINPSGGVLRGTLTQAATGGIAYFNNLYLNQAGVGYTLVASATGVDVGTSNPFTIIPGVPTALHFIQQPQTIGAGFAQFPYITVEALDALGNRCTNCTGTVRLVLAGGTKNAVLSGTQTQADGSIQQPLGGTPLVAPGFAAPPAIPGVAQFPDLRVDLVGTAYTLVATGTVTQTGVITPVAINLPALPSLPFDVTQGAAYALKVLVQPVNTAVGLPNRPAVLTGTPAVQVAVVDAGGNTVTTDNTTVVTIGFSTGGNPTTAVLGGTLARTVINGIAYFDDLTVDMVGTGYQLTAASSPLLPVDTTRFDILEAGTVLAFKVLPQNVVAGGVINLATVPPPLGVQVQIGTGVGAAFVPALGDNSTRVTLALDPTQNPVGATLTGTLTRTAVQGVVTFDDLVIDRAGHGFVLIASTGVLPAPPYPPGTILPVKSAAFDVSAGPAASLIYAQQPVTSQAGALIPVSVKLLDVGGNLCTGDNATQVSIALDPTANPGGVKLNGTLTRTASAGVVQFTDLRLNTAGIGYRLIASVVVPATPTTRRGRDTGVPVPTPNPLPGTGGTGSGTGSGGSTTTPATPAAITSQPFDILRGPASRLVFGVQPSSTPTLAFIPTVVVQLQDALANVIADDNTTLVTLSLSNNPTSALLGGTLSRVLTNGSASFTDLTLDKAGTGYVLQAAATAQEAAQSEPFDILGRVPSPARTTIVAQPAVIASDGLDTAVLTVTLKDANGVVVQGSPASVRSIAVSPVTGVEVVSLGAVTDGLGQFQVTLKGHAVGHYDIVLRVGTVTLNKTAISVQDTFTRTFSPGLAFIGLPILPLDQRPLSVLGNGSWRLARYDGTANAFNVFSATDNETEPYWFVPGRGVFVRFNASTSVRVLGTYTLPGRFGLVLNKGWNTLANPFTADIPWNLADLAVLVSGREIPLSDPLAWSSVAPYVWVFNGLTNALVFDSSFAGFGGVQNNVPTLSGFWVYSAVDGAQLIVRPRGSSSRAAAPAAPTSQAWTVRLEAGAAGGGVTVGQQPQLGRGLRIAAAPPVVAGGHTLEVLANDGTRLAGEVRADGDQAPSWDLLLTAGAAGEVALSWPTLSRGLPEGKLATLVDLSNGRSVCLNTRGSYVCTAQSAGEQRRLRLTVRDGRAQRPTIENFAVAGGKQVGGLSLSLTLSAPADVSLTVTGVGGRTVRKLPSQSVAAGLVTLNWDLLDEAGRLAPRGTYVLEAVAVGADGAASRASRTVNLP